jgi:hypothetical protein
VALDLLIPELREARMNRMTYVFAVVIVTTLGCENIAILPWRDVSDDLARRGSETDTFDRRRAERERDIRETTLARNEIVGTVQKIDEGRREIHLRTAEGRMVRIKYDTDTAVFSRNREMRVDSLNYGDLILVRVNSDIRGEQHADVIRMNDRQDALR